MHTSKLSWYNRETPPRPPPPARFSTTANVILLTEERLRWMTATDPPLPNPQISGRRSCAGIHAQAPTKERCSQTACQAREDCSSSKVTPGQFQFWLDWFQSASCLPAGPLPTARRHAWRAEVTLRADPVAMNKSEGLWTEEPQLHSDLRKQSRRLRLSQFCSSSTPTFESFSAFRRIFAVFLPLSSISRELIKVYFPPSQLLNK